MSFSSHGANNRTIKYFTRGNTLAMQGQYREALRCYEKVLSATPTHLDALNNQANCYSMLGRYDRAIAGYDKVLAVKPNDLRARANRATALKNIGRIKEATADYEHVLAMEPTYADALFNRGNMFIDIARPKEAIRDLRLALSQLPNDTDIHTSLIFALNFDPDATTESQQAERARWAAPYARFLTQITHGDDPDPERRLRIGYVSRYFRHQAATYAFGGVIMHHDPSQFEVVCYSDTETEDDLTIQLRSRANIWHRTLQLSDESLAQLIRNDRIDILVDLVGHMKGHRLRAFAFKPAPVQVTGWGEPTGTGLKAMDYLFVGPAMIPQGERALFPEEIVELPNYIGFWSPTPLPAPRPLPAMERGYVTFGSFNRLAKVIDPVVRCWAAILRSVPGSRLVLKDRPLAPEYQKATILTAFAEEGVTSDRITLLDQSDRISHFAAYGDIDIALDPFPHSGGMTTLDALWMGVPVITAPGRIVSSRIAAATMTAAGLSDFIATDYEAYVALAVSKSGDLTGLANIRSSLRHRLAETEFGDPARYSHAVERQYRAMWRKWCSLRPSGKAN